MQREKKITAENGEKKAGWEGDEGRTPEVV